MMCHKDRPNPSVYKLRRILPLLGILLFSANAFAQLPKGVKDTSQHEKKVATETGHHKEVDRAAILRQRDAERDKKLKALVAADSVLNNIGIDSILGKIDNMHIVLNRINNTTGHGFSTNDIEEGLPQVDSDIQTIDENLLLYSSVLDVKNLQMFQVLLSDMQDQLTDWRTTLSDYDKQLGDMRRELIVFKRDTVLKQIVADSAFRNLYSPEVTDLEQREAQAKTSVHENLSRINQMQANVSNAYFESIDLKNKIRAQLRKLSLKAIGKEYDYLWDAGNYTADVQQRALIRSFYSSQRKILISYFNKKWDDRIWMILIGTLFVIWVSRNFRYLKKNENNNDGNDAIAIPKFKYLKRLPVLSALVIIFCVAPFFDIHPPSAYVQIMGFLLVITLTLLFIRSWPGKLFYYWLVISVFFVVFAIVSAILTPNLYFRLWLLVLNVVSIGFGVFFLLNILKKNSISILIKVVAVIYVLLNLAAALCNMFGRLSMAKIFGNTAIFGLMQIIGLSVFIQIVTESVQLQLVVSKLKDSLLGKVDFDEIKNKLQRILTAIAILLWFIVFTISTNIYNLLFFWFDHLLTDPRKIGTTTFEIGNIFLFLIIIYVSNLLQKGIGALYEVNETHGGAPAIDKNGSRLVITRLVLLLIGFFLAVTASGLPIDKITIVLGALSVGIGLGLQSIVNNLVSGVILIFERPFRIGDYIELDNKKGRVRDIGIRSSKLVTEEGAEIIMPNADLLSGRVVNWTLRDNNARIELPLTIEPGAKMEDVQQYIIDAIATSKDVIKGMPPEILLNGITDKSVNLNVRVWVNDVHQMQVVKSELLNTIYTQLAAHSIKMI